MHRTNRFPFDARDPFSPLAGRTTAELERQARLAHEMADGITRRLESDWTISTGTRLVLEQQRRRLESDHWEIRRRLDILPFSTRASDRRAS